MLSTNPPLRRGQMWQLPTASGRTRAFLVLEADSALAAYPLTAVCVLVDTSGTAPDTLLTASLSHPVTGTVIGLELHTLTVSRLQQGKYAGIVGDEEMADASRAVRPALDLTD